MSFLSKLSSTLKDFLLLLEQEGFKLTLVGGACRDYFLKNDLGTDLDFELRGKSISDLTHFLVTNKIKHEVLPYEIVRFDFENYQLEFSAPRKEIPLKDKLGHHHFEAIIDQSLSYQDSFARRDFTFNAIGVEFNLSHLNEKIIDPYAGQEDLKAKKLRPITDDFYLDPVRFLRLIRFAVKFQFEIDHSLFGQMGSFNLKELSRYHFISELKKSKNAKEFVDLFFKEINHYKIILASDYLFLSEIPFLAKDFDEKEILVETAKKKNKRAQEFSNFFSLKDKTLKDVLSFLEAANFLRHNPLERVKGKKINEMIQELTHLKTYHQKAQWVIFDLPFLIDLKKLDEVKVDENEIANLPNEEKSLFRYYKFINSL